MPGPPGAYAVALALVLPSLAAAQDGAPDGGPAVPAVGALKEVRGRVSGYDPAQLTVTLDTGSGPLPLRVDRNTTVFVKKGVGTLRDVRQGLEARAAYEAGETPPRAQWLEIEKPDPLGPPAEGPATTTEAPAAPPPPAQRSPPPEPVNPKPDTTGAGTGKPTRIP
jgi:hypothetical protein